MIDGERLVALADEAAQAEGLRFGGAVALSDLDDADRLRRWLDSGYHGEMSYLPKWEALRARPAEHFPPHLSALVFLVPYPTEAPCPDPAVGNIARYALGDDYHEVIRAALLRVGASLVEADPTLICRPCVDTAPILEKVAAERAGVGWQGKHTNLIREGEGSWFFLAELLVDRDVVTSDRATDRCGTCRRCIDVCPTAAIVEPYVLDARRCISYLTIELRGPIPIEFREHIGHRIFGCDDCQEVCPWNRFAASHPREELRPREGLRDRSLVEWLEMDIEEWRRVFRRSAVKRAKYAGFKRNVAVSLGCLADPRTLPAIEDALGREEALVRQHLVWALGRIDGGNAVLQRHRANENDEAVLDEYPIDLRD